MGLTSAGGLFPQLRGAVKVRRSKAGKRDEENECFPQLRAADL